MFNLIQAVRKIQEDYIVYNQGILADLAKLLNKFRTNKRKIN